MNKKVSLFLLAISGVTMLISCSKCENEYITRQALGFEKVMELGVEGCLDYYIIPGCAWAVIDKDGVTSGTAGDIIFGSGEPVDLSHRFQTGSLGKSYTSLMAARQVEDRLINWDTRLFDVFPQWQPNAHIAYEDLTLADLLSHNTRLHPLNSHKTHIDRNTGKLVYENIPNFSGTDYDRRREFCQYALSLNPVETENGNGVNYGNANYVLAGCMLEEVAGKTWEEMALELASAMDMEIGFERPNMDDPSQPWGHYLQHNCLQPVAPHNNKIINDPLLSPAGNIHVSISDFSQYVGQFLNALNNEDGVVKAESFKYLLMGRDKYAMGWYNDFGNDSIFYHYGSENTFYSHMMIFSNLDAAIIIFANADTGDNSFNFINDTRNYLKQKYIYNKNQ